MDAAELKDILKLHKLWLNKKKGGKIVWLYGADLLNANLRSADLRSADLRHADLRHTNLIRADLTEAYLDFSSLPLWCGSLDIKVDIRIAAQIAYHFCRLDCKDIEYIKARNALTKLANAFHRVNECGKIEKKQAPSKKGSQ